MSARSRRALITGGAGQDGIHLARRLADHGWQVISTVRSTEQAARVRRYVPEARPVLLDVRDAGRVGRVVCDTAPHVVFNLAGVSSVARSWQEPELTWATNHEAVGPLLDAVARADAARFVQASSAEVDRGSASPYAEAKAAADEQVRRRRARGMHASVAILHAHESPLRPLTFVSRKVTRAAAAIAGGAEQTLSLGTVDVRRDWGAARDHVTALELMALRDEPDDFEIGTGHTHSLRDLVETAFAAAGVDDPWTHVVHDPALVRPQEATSIVADIADTERRLGWHASTTFEQTIDQMVAADLQRLATGVEDDRSWI